MFAAKGMDAAAKGEDSAAKGKDSAAKDSAVKGSTDNPSASNPTAPEVTPPRLILSLKFDGSDAFDYFRPPLLRFATTLDSVEAASGQAARLANVVWETCVPLPAGMWMRRRPSDNMPLLPITDIHSVRFRRIFGYVGEIKLIRGEPGDEIDFDSPAMVIVVAEIWRRYGPPQGRNARQLGAASHPHALEPLVF